jgi:multidrug efflux pump subunit AcrA (membrane-fusion protein)
MEIKSPLDGVIIHMMNQSGIGQTARPFRVGDQIWAGAYVAQIPDLKTLEVECRIEETDRGRVKQGDPVRVRVDALPESTFDARLDQISSLTVVALEFPPIASFRGYARLTNPDPRLRPGMNASLDVITQRLPNAISIPAKALFTESGNPIVYVAGPENAFERRPVKVLARNPDEVAIEGVPEAATVALLEPGSKGSRQ